MNPIELINKLIALYKLYNPTYRIENETLYFEIEKSEFDTSDYINFQLASSHYHYAFNSVSFKNNRLIIKIRKSL